MPPTGDGFYLVRIAFSADGRALAASRTDNILQVWDITSGKELLRRTGFDSHAYALAFAPDGKRLASGHQNGDILVWDLTPEIERRPILSKPDAKTVEQWWTALASQDAKQAHTAIWGLIAAPEQALPMLRGRLRPASAPPAGKMRQLVAELDNDEFARRESAFKQLAELEELAEPLVREALRQEVTSEARRRLEKLLSPSLVVRSPEKLRSLRALQGTGWHAGSSGGLIELAMGAPEARLTREATAARERLKK